MYTTQQVIQQTLQFTKETGPSSVICFDYFDTLVSRDIMPEYTKHTAARQLSILLAGFISADEIYRTRQKLEIELCEQSRVSGFDLEFRLSELAAKLYTDIKTRFTARDQPFAFSLTDFVDTVMHIELAIEKQAQVRCDDMVDLLRTLRTYDCRIILISDFYLPKNYFEQLLVHHGIDDCFDHIYISADRLISKGSGRLYECIMEELGVSSSSMLMIGDNSHADGAMAREKGITSLLIDRSDIRRSYEKWQERYISDSEAVLSNIRLLNIVREDGPDCFPEIGLSIWDFIHRLFCQLIKDKANTVFFLSREGEFLQELFELYQIENFGQIIIQSRYLVVSRKSCYIASLSPIETENFEKLFFQYRDISARDFLLSLNFSERIARDLCEKLEVSWEKRQVNFPQSTTFKQITESDEFREHYETLRTRQKVNLFRYIKSLGFDMNIDTLFLVDVGWKGSMQENIFRVFDGRIRINGYYVGLLKSTIEDRNMNKKGILFTENPVKSSYFDVYNNNRSLFEMILGASHGSAEGYFNSPQEIEERSNILLKVHTSIEDDEGKLLITTCEQPEEITLYKDKIEPFQFQLKEKILKINKAIQLSCKSVSNIRWFAKQHARMVFLPTKAEIKYFEELYHLENFGVFEFTRFSPSKETSWRKKIYNLKSVILDPAILEIGFWPPVILRHLGIGFYRYADGRKRYHKAFGKWLFQTKR